ncbi:hypothetical protein ACSZOI_05655 [Aeromonas caviae]
MIVAKPLRAKDRACLEAWIEGGSLTEAYRAHLASRPEGASVRQAAWAWSRQPHIKAAMDTARTAVIETQFGDAKALLLEQAKRLDEIYRLGVRIGPNGPNSLPAALGATMALSKLFQDSVLSGLTKLNMLKLWTDIQGELMIPEATKRRIAETILAGDPI